MRLPDARRTFGDLHQVHVATTMPDGSPHVVPMWFVWAEEAIYVSCRQGSSTWRNVERDPRVALTLGLGTSWRELAGVVVHGRAELMSPEHPALRGVMSAWYEKYRPLLAGEAFRSFAEQVARPGMLRIRVMRLAGWDHAAWEVASGERRSEAGGT